MSENNGRITAKVIKLIYIRIIPAEHSTRGSSSARHGQSDVDVSYSGCAQSVICLQSLLGSSSARHGQSVVDVLIVG
ncbi:MAG: hypothetical protein EZS28_040931 [Streblomastix strix]|uniref:Uncharacterized protein n=1 Tax=Streblomastix strix TaxID=222440 RepID=A0A5J4U0K7_9EUKA|nr:MAG: hypothetical protein EZS28_040931 [Streblomastix strix]